ncbi:S26 family signal peptidase [Hamadaea sp. NPDC051192]|uniref:S26 family signal peptidase n=1 Tax=Hamadaea sp. NPDC051192 TaxID=3154940 RepID=UPI00343176DC
MSPLIAVKVRGPSMEPALTSGRTVLVVRGLRLRVGDVIVVERPDELEPARWLAPPLSGSLRTTQWLVKRVAALPGDVVPEPIQHLVRTTIVPTGAVVLLGDNRPVSYDSRQAGFFPRDRVLGRVVGTRRVSPVDADMYGAVVGCSPDPGNPPGRTDEESPHATDHQAR